MIAARLVLSADGSPLRFEAEGHSGRAPRGGDIVCSAFSVLARSAYEALAAIPGAEIEGTAPARGSLRFVVKRLSPETVERAAGIADFLQVGISSLEREYPGEVGLTIERNWRE